MKLKTTTCCCAAIFGLSTAGSAFSAGFQLLEQNASGLGNAYAGSAVVAENASTIFYNPAGMTQLKGDQVSVGLDMVKPSFKFTNEGSSPSLLSGNGGDAGGWNAVPNAYASFANSEKLFFGLGISAPFGLKTEYPNPWVGAAQSLTFDIKVINVNPSVAYKLDPKVSLGFGADIQKMDARYIRVVSGANATYAASTATLDAKSTAYGWNAGVLYTPASDLKIGVAYRSQVQHQLKGSIVVNGPNATLNAMNSSDITADIHLPDTWIVSASKTFGDFELLGDVERIGWGSVPNVEIIRSNGGVVQTLGTDFRDTWRVALGSTYRMNSAWKLKTGIAWDQTPVQSAADRLVSMPDNDRIWLSAGTQWAINQQSTLDLGAAYLFIRDSSIDNNQAAAGRSRITGSYKGSVLILGVQYSQSF